MQYKGDIYKSNSHMIVLPTCIHFVNNIAFDSVPLHFVNPNVLQNGNDSLIKLPSSNWHVCQQSMVNILEVQTRLYIIFLK